MENAEFSALTRRAGVPADRGRAYRSEGAL